MFSKTLLAATLLTIGFSANAVTNSHTLTTGSGSSAGSYSSTTLASGDTYEFSSLNKGGGDATWASQHGTYVDDAKSYGAESSTFNFGGFTTTNGLTSFGGGSTVTGTSRSGNYTVDSWSQVVGKRVTRVNSGEGYSFATDNYSIHTTSNAAGTDTSTSQTVTDYTFIK